MIALGQTDSAHMQITDTDEHTEIITAATTDALIHINDTVAGAIVDNHVIDYISVVRLT